MNLNYSRILIIDGYIKIIRKFLAVIKASESFFKVLSNIAYMSVARYPQDDSFKASKKLCDLVHPGIVAIFGPTSAFASNHVQSAAEALHLPFMETRWNYNFQRSAYSIRWRQLTANMTRYW